MADSILDWLDAEDGAQDIYSLLGHPRFDPDQKSIKSSINQATRDLLPYQSHNNNAVAQKAMRLLTELGGAEIVVDDPEKLKEHEKQIVNSLYDEYARKNGDDVESWDRSEVQSWLERDAAVHPSAVKSTLEVLCPAVVEEVDLVDIDELESEEAEQQAKRLAAKKREQAKRKKLIAKRKQEAEQRKEEQKKKKAADRLEDILEDLGVRPQNADWRFRSTRQKRAERRGGKGKSKGRGGKSRGKRGRRHQKDSPMKWVMIAGGSVLLIGLLVIWLIFGGGQPDPAVVKVDLSPADAKLTVYRIIDPDDTTKVEVLGEEDGVTVKVVGSMHTVSFVGANLEENYKVIATHEKHIENGFTWKPTPKTMLEQPLKLPPKKGGD